MEKPLYHCYHDGVLVLDPRDRRALAHHHQHGLQERGVRRTDQDGGLLRRGLLPLDSDHEAGRPEDEEPKVGVLVQQGTSPADQRGWAGVGPRVSDEADLGPEPGGQEDEHDGHGAEWEDEDGAHDALEPHPGRDLQVQGEGVYLLAVEPLAAAGPVMVASDCFPVGGRRGHGEFCKWSLSGTTGKGRSDVLSDVTTW